MKPDVSLTGSDQEKAEVLFMFFASVFTHENCSDTSVLSWTPGGKVLVSRKLKSLHR